MNSGWMGPADAYSHSTRGNRNRRTGEEERRNSPIARLVSHREALRGLSQAFNKLRLLLLAPQHPRKRRKATSFFRWISHYLWRISWDLGKNLVRSHPNSQDFHPNLMRSQPISQKISFNVVRSNSQPIRSKSKSCWNSGQSPGPLGRPGSP